MELISVHVPKTAGTSFWSTLVEVYGVDRIYRDYDYVYERERFETRRVIHGHFSVAKYHGLFPEARRVTWVRHPVRWIISLYYYEKWWPRTPINHLQCRLHDDDLSLLEYAQHPRARDQVSRYFLYGMDLADFFFVGLTEHFADDLKALARRLGWSEVAPHSDNPNPLPGYAENLQRHLADRPLVRKLEACFEKDMALYERARTLRARRLRRERGERPWRAVHFLGSLAPRTASARR